MPVPEPSEVMQTRCCVVGGGPAGVVLGFLLARAGVPVTVLEKHGDFLRDFRGDTIHPSTLEVLQELGLLDEFLTRPHSEARTLTGVVGGREVRVADFSGLKTPCPFIAFMPQWEFLDFLVGHARRFPGFTLRMNANVTDVVEEDGRVVGVRAKTPDGPLEVRAGLTVAADGRHSTLRSRAGLPVQTFGSPIDVLWMRISRIDDDPSEPLGRFDGGRVFVMIDRTDYWQCGFVIQKGGYDKIVSRGIEAFRDDVRAIAPFLGDRVNELRTFDDVKLLTITVDRLRRWHIPGLLCIGDSAHAMSPVGGVGINLAIQDAIATANILGPVLRDSNTPPSPRDLQKVQDRRLWPTRLTQRLQVLIQNQLISRALAKPAGPPAPAALPFPLRMLQWFPRLRRIPARIIGIGFRPEHVSLAERTPVA